MILEQILSRQLDWISAAEARINPLLTIETAMLAALFTAHLSNSVYYGVGRSLSWLAQVLLAVGLVCLAIACFPRTRGPTDSVIFFRSIAKRSAKAYAEVMGKLSSADYVADLSTQVHRNAEIADVKFHWISLSLVALLVAVPVWVYSFAALVATRLLE